MARKPRLSSIPIYDLVEPELTWEPEIFFFFLKTAKPPPNKPLRTSTTLSIGVYPFGDVLQPAMTGYAREY